MDSLFFKGGKMPSEEEVVVQVRFICCSKTIPFDPVFDFEGFLICPVHGERRYGWRSSRVVDSSKWNRPNYGESSLEQDQAIVKELFGDIGK
jgi:hypothetical protein